MKTRAVYYATLFILFTPPSLIAGTKVFFNAHIRISDKAGTTADWIAVTDGKIAGYGVKEEFGSFENAPRVDLKGKWVLPGLTDSHAHIVSMGRELTQADLRGTKSAAEAVAKVKAYLASGGAGKTGPIVGNGWDQSDWPGKDFPTRALLDAVSTKRPILLYRVDGHAAWVNTRALKVSGLWRAKGSPVGGRILRGTNGEPTGVLIDRASAPVEELISRPTDEQLARAVTAAVKEALSYGITGIHDAGATTRHIETIRRLLQSKAVKFRFYEMASTADPVDFKKFLDRGPEVGAEDGQLTVRAVKLFADGAMGSRGALFERPYDDDKSTSGLWVTDYDKLVNTMRHADERGFQVAVHAIGSLANHRMIDAFETLFGETTAARRPRLEHAQVLTEPDLARIGKLGIVASMQPVHCTSDLKWVEARIGKDRARYAYAWKSLLKKGAHLAFGSDAPVESVNPWHGLFAATTRGGFHVEESVSLGEAFRAYTTGAAFASFSESDQGTLEPGHYADFTLAPTDPFKAAPTALNDFKVEATYVGGDQVWAGPGAPDDLRAE